MKCDQIEQYKIRYRLDAYICQGCGSPATQQAHRIANTKINRRKYGAAVIDHNINTVSSCQSCNDGFNIGGLPVIAEKLAVYIDYVLYCSEHPEEGGPTEISSKYIDDMIRQWRR